MEEWATFYLRSRDTIVCSKCYKTTEDPKVHQQLTGRRKKHRTKVLQWLKMRDKKKYKLVLCVLAKEPLYMLYKEVTEG